MKKNIKAKPLKIKRYILSGYKLYQSELPVTTTGTYLEQAVSRLKGLIMKDKYGVEYTIFDAKWDPKGNHLLTHVMYFNHHSKSTFMIPIPLTIEELNEKEY
jgi:hypothetical protein